MPNRSLLIAVIVIALVAIFIFYLAYTGKIPLVSSSNIKPVPFVYNESFGSIVSAFPSMSVTIKSASYSPSPFLNGTVSYSRTRALTVNGLNVDELNITYFNDTLSSTYWFPIYVYANGTVDKNLTTMGLEHSNGTLVSEPLMDSILTYESQVIEYFATGQLSSSIVLQYPGWFSYFSNYTYTQTVGSVSMVVTKYTLTRAYSLPTSDGGGQIKSAVFEFGRPDSNQSVEVLLYFDLIVNSSSGANSSPGLTYLLYKVDSLSSS